MCALPSEAHCAPKVQYAVVRERVEQAFAAKAHELHDSIAVVQSLSRSALLLLEKLHTHCGDTLREAQAVLNGS